MQLSMQNELIESNQYTTYNLCNFLSHLLTICTINMETLNYLLNNIKGS